MEVFGVTKRRVETIELRKKKASVYTEIRGNMKKKNQIYSRK